MREGAGLQRGGEHKPTRERRARGGWGGMRAREIKCVSCLLLFLHCSGSIGVCPSRLHHLLYVEQLPFLQRIHILPKCATSATSRNHQEASYRIVTLKRDLQSLDGQGTPLKSRSLSSDGGRRRRINETSDGVFSRACCCSRGGGLHRVALGRCAGEIR